MYECDDARTSGGEIMGILRARKKLTRKEYEGEVRWKCVYLGYLKIKCMPASANHIYHNKNSKTKNNNDNKIEN